jgi:hypothetical protein
MSDDLEQQLRENASSPKRARGDSGEMEQHSISDQIAADRYLNSKKAARSRSGGLRMTKIVPPGAG